MWKNIRFYHVAHSMKRIEILLNLIRDRNKFKNRDFFYFLWLNVSRLLFVIFFIQCVKTTICFIWFNVSRLFLSLSRIKKFFVFPFTLFTSTPLYTNAHNTSCNSISNTPTDQNRCHLSSIF